MTGSDDRQGGNGQRLPEEAGGFPGDDPLEARWARLAAFWALVLRRFHDYARNSDPAGGLDRQSEEDR